MDASVKLIILGVVWRFKLMVGPYISFNNRTWTNSFRNPMNPKPGGWDRLYPVAKDGSLGSKEVEVYWQDSSNLYLSGTKGRKISTPFVDLGSVFHVVTEKEALDIVKKYPEAKVLAKSIFTQLTKEGFDKDQILSFVGQVAEDVNHSKLWRALPKASFPETKLSVSTISGQIDYDIIMAEAIAFYTSLLAKDRSLMSEILKIVADTEQRFLQADVARTASKLASKLKRIAKKDTEFRRMLQAMSPDSDPKSKDQNKPETYMGLPPKGIQAAATSYEKKLLKDISFKDGTKVPKDTKATITFRAKDYDKCDVKFEGFDKTYALGTTGLKDKFGAPFMAVPSEATLEKWDESGKCKTVTGKTTEPDGTGPDGSPSWLLAMGMI